MKDLNTYGTYPTDYDLFTKLGLNKFKEIPNWSSVRVGKTTLFECNIEIWVEGCPAQFWTINIEFGDGSKKRVSTGSGTLSEYWKSIEDICSGCLVVDII